MRLIEKSISRNLFESLKEDKITEAINDAFDGTDFIVNYIDSNDDYNVTVSLSAVDGDGEELSRDVNFEFSSDDYDEVYNVCSEWIETHNSPDLFYENVNLTESETFTMTYIPHDKKSYGEDYWEGSVGLSEVKRRLKGSPNGEIKFKLEKDDYGDIPEYTFTFDKKYLDQVKNTYNALVDIADVTLNENVMINTGSTTITSDETGVVVEDNGNTITTGNGVTVDVNNTQDVLSPETDITEPVEEMPLDGELADVPTEDIENIESTEEDEDDDEEDEDLDESIVNEAIDKDGGPFPYLMKHGQGPGTLPDDVEVVKYGESSNDKDIVYLNKVLTAEEEAKYDMKPMEKLEDCDTKPIKEADGYNQNQNVEIYQNPEFDYQILDITELDNVDTGDIRSIDMANILNDLDESLTEACGDETYFDINSFLTRKGNHKKTNESYSSAIIELTLPKLNESIGEYKNTLFLEVYGDKAMKECVVRNSKSQIIKEYSGKSKNPVEHFKNVMLDIDRARKITEEVHYAFQVSLPGCVPCMYQEDWSEDEAKKDYLENEGAETDYTIDDVRIDYLDEFDESVVPMVNKSEKEDNINFANSNATDKDKERQEKHLKQRDKLNKDSKFKVEKEPDQDNTTGNTEEEITDTAEVEALPKTKKTKVNAEKLKVKEIKESEKLTEAEDELLDDPEITDGSDLNDELDESGSDVAIFHKKPASVDAMRAAENNGITTNKANYKIIGTKELSGEEFNEFANHLSSPHEWLKNYSDTSNSGEFKCVEVVNTEDNSFSILVDPNSYDYARYAAIKDNTNEEELLEPEEELLDEPTEEEVNNEE